MTSSVLWNSHLPTQPGGSTGKEPACTEGDLGLSSGLGRAQGQAVHTSILAWRIP